MKSRSWRAPGKCNRSTNTIANPHSHRIASKRKGLRKEAFFASEADELSSDRQELGQRGLIEHRRGLIRGLQAGLQRQDLGRNLVLVDALDLVEHGLRHSLELGLAVGRGLDGVLRAGEL